MAEYKLTDRLQHAWSALTRAPTETSYKDMGAAYSTRPDRKRLTRGNERSIINSIYNRIAMDVAAVDIKHVRLDENDRFLDEVDSGLNNVLQLDANIDQTGRALIQDLVMSMFDEGVVALMPIETDIKPNETGAYDIKSMRTAKILEWYPKHVKLMFYNEETGRLAEIIMHKRNVAIIENPFYSVMNEPNSTLKRLVRKLNLLDKVDEQTSSGKLDLIIQLPYELKTDSRRKQAEQRRKDIEMQLSGSQYGIAYTAATEKVTQLNRPIENNLLKQIESLTSTLYGQLGLTEEIFKGTADEKTMLNYYNSTVEPILSAITNELKRKFLTKTARTQGQSIEFFKDPFRLVPVNNIAEIADKFTRNEIMTSNEIRQVIGIKPSDDPKADMLVNSNLNQSPDQLASMGLGGAMPNQMGEEEISYAEGFDPYQTPVSQLPPLQ